MKHLDPTKLMGCKKSSSKKEIQSSTILPQEKRETSNNLTLHLKQLEKEEKTKPNVSRRKEIIKITTEINEKETKETAVKINKTESYFFEKIKLTSHQSDSARKKYGLKSTKQEMRKERLQEITQIQGS